MDTIGSIAGWNDVYALWHIPSSTLLLSTASQMEAVERVQTAISDGYCLCDLMLQVTPEGELLGAQHLGDRIAEALALDLLLPAPESP